jgi:von Willebrand factor type A domain
MRHLKTPAVFFVLALLFVSCSKTSADVSKYSTETGGISTGAAAGGGQNGDSTLAAGVITAGEWNDLSNWGFWESLLAKNDFDKFPIYWGFNTSLRIAVELRNEQGYVLVDEPLVLQDGSGNNLTELRTDNSGRAEFFPNLHAGQATLKKLSDLQINAQQQNFTSLISYANGINKLVLKKTAVTPAVADIAFVVDATGSMGDEINYLKTELDNVIHRVQAKYNLLTVHTAAVFYRDEGDDYVTKKSPFSTDFNQVLNFIKQQNADGGGDFPEALHTALKESTEVLNWSTSARCRLLFLLLDAPPHYSPSILRQIHAAVETAAKKGIKIIPIAASGIDKETELLLRYFSIATNGSYVFITNHSGIGNDHLEASVGKYEVEYLNNLMVRLIGQYLQ